MDLPTALLLGMVQGLTEWLPVSSSGHLVIFEHLSGVRPPLFFNIALHLGTAYDDGTYANNIIANLYVYNDDGTASGSYGNGTNTPQA